MFEWYNWCCFLSNRKPFLPTVVVWGFDKYCFEAGRRLSHFPTSSLHRSKLVSFGVEAGGCGNGKYSFLFETVFVKPPYYYFAVPPRAPAVDSTHLPASTSLLGIERFFDDNNVAGNLQGYNLVIPTSISSDNQVLLNLINFVYLLHEIYTY